PKAVWHYPFQQWDFLNTLAVATRRLRTAFRARESILTRVPPISDRRAIDARGLGGRADGSLSRCRQLMEVDSRLVGIKRKLSLHGCAMPQARRCFKKNLTKLG